MKNISKTRCIALLAVGIALFSFSACTNANAQAGRANPAQVERWEYRMIWLYHAWESYIRDYLEPTLNRLGNEGWKLVSVAPQGGTIQGNFLVTFKRRLP